MTDTLNPAPTLTTRLINGVLAIQPLAKWAKRQARQMMVERAEKLGVPWREEAAALRRRDLETLHQTLENPDLVYPEYYLTSFHAYEEGNMSWEVATEVEVASKAVHASIWPEEGVRGDTKLRQNFCNILKERLPVPPKNIVDIGSSVGLTTFYLHALYPEAKLTGVDLSPYCLAVGASRSQERNIEVNWVHAAGEATGLPEVSFDLVTLVLVCHELPIAASCAIFREAHRLLRSGGHLAIMEMNPKSEVFAQFPPYVMALLKSTEPYLDEYFALDMEGELVKAGFDTPTIDDNSPRHRTVIAVKP
ncbi:MAG: class I SAM-dependent methyltransferase [Cyanobacteria bacterium SID2]|nr:class I SAM-dependent methyltransferase [Cyanobacteria bacterium SID2]MBP0004563.1 class I SAM-dependent methyltransferase [Cyanobacteria bacterium SBC]